MQFPSDPVKAYEQIKQEGTVVDHKRYIREMCSALFASLSPVTVPEMPQDQVAGTYRFGILSIPPDLDQVIAQLPERKLVITPSSKNLLFQHHRRLKSVSNNDVLDGKGFWNVTKSMATPTFPDELFETPIVTKKNYESQFRLMMKRGSQTDHRSELAAHILVNKVHGQPITITEQDGENGEQRQQLRNSIFSPELEPTQQEKQLVDQLMKQRGPIVDCQADQVKLLRPFLEDTLQEKEPSSSRLWEESKDPGLFVISQPSQLVPFCSNSNESNSLSLFESLNNMQVETESTSYEMFPTNQSWKGKQRAFSDDDLIGESFPNVVEEEEEEMESRNKSTVSHNTHRIDSLFFESSSEHSIESSCFYPTSRIDDPFFRSNDPTGSLVQVPTQTKVVYGGISQNQPTVFPNEKEPFLSVPPRPTTKKGNLISPLHQSVSSSSSHLIRAVKSFQQKKKQQTVPPNVSSENK